MGRASDIDVVATLFIILVFGTAAVLTGLLMWSDTGEDLQRSDDSFWSKAVVQDLQLPVFAFSTVVTGTALVGFIWSEWQHAST